MKKITGIKERISKQLLFSLSLLILCWLFINYSLFAQCSTTIGTSPMNWSATTGWTCTPAPNTEGHVGTWGSYAVNGLDGGETLNVDINLELTSPLTLSGSRGSQAVFVVKAGKTLKLNSFDVGSNIKIVVENTGTLELTGSFTGGSNVTIENYGTIHSTNLLNLSDGSTIYVESGASMYFGGEIQIAANFVFTVNGSLETPSNVTLGSNGYFNLDGGSVKTNSLTGGINVEFNGPGTMEGTDFSFGSGAACGSGGCPYVIYSSCRPESSEPCNSYCFPGEVDPGTITASASTTICSGSAMPTLTLNDYKQTILRWEYSVAPFSSWNTISNTSATYPASSTTLSQTTQFRAVVTGSIHSRCIVYSPTITITVNTSSPIWTGSVNSDWNNAGNWCAGSVPSISQDVVIPAASNNPVIKSSVAAFCKTLIVDPNSTLTIEDGSLVVGDESLMDGSATINGEIIFNHSSAQVTFNGDFTFNGTWTEAAGATVVFNSNATLNEGITTSSTISLNNSGVLTLPSSGKIVIQNSGTLTLATNASYLGASSNSFVDGTIVKNTASTDYFVFPIGKDTLYRPIGILPETAVPTTFTATYYNVNGQTGRTDKEASLVTISEVEYWQLDKSAGANAKVTLYWGKSSYVSENGDLSDLRVAHYDTDIWKDMGGELTVGSLWSKGGISTSSYLSSFSPFTISSITTIHTLPVDLASFSILEKGKEIQLQWETHSEMNNAGFEIQRSSDGVKDFEVMGFVTGTNSSTTVNHYSFVDKNPLSKDSYYRLKQIDENGNYRLSEVKLLRRTSNNYNSAIYPNPTHGKVTLLKDGLDLKAICNYTIVSPEGLTRTHQRNIKISSIDQFLSEDIATLHNGTYTLILTIESQQYIFKLVKI